MQGGEVPADSVDTLEPYNQRINELEEALIYLAEENALLCDKLNSQASLHAGREAEYRQVIADLQARLALAQAQAQGGV